MSEKPRQKKTIIQYLIDKFKEKPATDEEIAQLKKEKEKAILKMEISLAKSKTQSRLSKILSSLSSLNSNQASTSSKKKGKKSKQKESIESISTFGNTDPDRFKKILGNNDAKRFDKL